MALSNYSGVYNGRVLLQQRGTIGGLRYVFVKLQGGAKNDLVFPTTGCKLLNPFKGYGKFYASDLVEYRMGGIGYILKTYEAAKAYNGVEVVESAVATNGAENSGVTDVSVTAATFGTKVLVSGTYSFAFDTNWHLDGGLDNETLSEYGITLTGSAADGDTFSVVYVKPIPVDSYLFLKRDKYRHKPFVGDIIMKAPATLTGTGKAAAITAIEETTEGVYDVWKITLGTALDSMVLGDVLVEGTEVGSGKQALVTNPNMVLPWDLECLFEPATSDIDFDGARYMFSPVLSELAYLDRMSVLPESVKALNRSRVVGWFKI